jgi:glycosyltransferase involved in cell wall biosynthesis
MASGCAIVSTTPLDYCGKKVDIGNSEQIKKAIDYLINNPSVSIKMGKINREKAKEYNWDNFIENLIEIYEDVLH